MRTVQLEALILLAPAITPVLAASDSSRPRGVGPEFAKFFKDANTFTCISSPSVKIPFSRVNDDYCDCPDGSDEPGTSACSYISPLSPPTVEENTSLALPGFYCKNKGHLPAYVPFTNVNDGICDYEQCCDGSEEWEGVGGVKCEDKCKEIGKEWRKLDDARQKSLNNANRKRKELVTEAARLRKEVEDRLQTLATEIQGSELKVSGLEKELTDIERAEKGKVIRGAGKGGRMTVLISLAKGRTEELRSQLEKTRTERNDLKKRIVDLESILTQFKVEYNPNFNDEGVKSAVRRWEDYAAKDHPKDDPTREADLDEILEPDESHGLTWADYEKDDEESDVDVLYQFEKYLPASLRTWIDQKLRDLRIMLIENGILASPAAEGDEPQAIKDARERLKSAQDDLKKNRDELEKHKADLDTDYGPAEVFRALKSKCVSHESGEYTYEVCYLDKTKQIPRKGGAHTGMGNFVRIEKIMVDDELPPDGKGLGSGERWALKYENGNHCWNGPNRSTLVVLACADSDEVWKTVEEEKCVYRMEVGTPAVCEGAKKADDERAKDEL
ncbi:glucosidase 2 subunit beta precursor [Pseudovirgaria hyperparasitica]|uniref:Glucosidase 2 subunit beta n=1 Tax=Pseudovirgaria hyperparasitica TaxID=470096 RepID=A0A6A6WH02_9PEZI|nr:glucosidase 2 subunit beta precursor [Pseudovirgaria hyperparasitica]KAF2761354.1 glucosidase 2 subunit beta precursor [Pseudovirgaria hyperparasitica]